MAGRAVAWCSLAASLCRPGPKGRLMLKATDLTKAHAAAPLFDGLSLVLDDGARAGLVGVNGVGKTTLLRLLAGAARPDRGAVRAGAGARGGHPPPDVVRTRAT